MRLVFATHNQNKFKEIQAMLPESIELLNLQDLNLKEDIEETASTIEGNALLKARYVYEKLGINCFADDTGLEVKALNNAPGVYSARYAGESGDSQANIEKLLVHLEDKEDRSAKFRTVIALILDGEEHLFEGICAGRIELSQKGIAGFGYDPIFVPEGEQRTFAEMTDEEKAQISHRGKATAELIHFLTERASW